MTLTPNGEVVAEVQNEIVVVKLSRSRVLNALTPAMVTGLCHAVEEFSDSVSVGGMVVTGEGKAFCSGADIYWESQSTSGQFSEFIDGIQRLTRLLRESDLFVVAALNGMALGGGFELALACDSRVASPEAIVGFPEVKLGLTVTGGVSYMLPRIVGSSRALELLVSGRNVSAEEALGLGLVDSIAPDALAGGYELASVGVSCPPGLLGIIKSALYGGEEVSMGQALRIEKEAILEAFRQPAAREGLVAFLEKRAPQWEKRLREED